MVSNDSKPKKALKRRNSKRKGVFASGSSLKSKEVSKKCFAAFIYLIKQFVRVTRET